MKNSAEGAERPGLVDLTRLPLRDLRWPDDTTVLAHSLRRAVGDKQPQDAVSAFNSAI